MANLLANTTIGGRNIVQEFDSHKNDKVAHIDYAVASGTNSYTANIQGITALVEGLSVKIKFQNANTGASTLNINGLGAKEIRKSNGNVLSAGNIKAGQICHLVYTGSVFQLLGEGGEYGTAQPEHVLQGYTIGTENGVVQGTMPNQGQKIITPSTVNIAIPRGFHDGTGYVEGSVNLKPENIKNGVNVFGVIGNLISITPNAGTIPLYSKTGVVFSDDDHSVPTYKGYIEFSHAGTYVVRYTTYGKDKTNSQEHQYAVPVSQLYLNGSPLTERRVNTSYIEQTWTSVHTVSAGDRIEFYLCKKNNYGVAYVVYIENVQVLIDKTYPTVTLGK